MTAPRPDRPQPKELNVSNRLDLTDPDIRAMAEFNHQPHELWYRGSVSVTCQTCAQEWPCPTRQELNQLT